MPQRRRRASTATSATVPRDDDTEAVVMDADRERGRSCKRHRRVASSSSSSGPSALRVPLDVLQHSVCAYLSLLEAVEVRRVSSSFRGACEQQAVAWMSRTFAAGLQPWPCPRPSHGNVEWYVWDDAMWVYRQFQYWQSRAADEAAAVTASLGLQVDACNAAHFYHGLRISRGGNRVSLLRALQGALARHGSSGGFSSWQQLRHRRWASCHAYTRYSRYAKPARRLLKAAGLQSKQDGSDAATGRYKYDRGTLTLWMRGGRWRGELHREPSNAQLIRFAAVHDLLIPVCDGRCGWGGCGD